MNKKIKILFISHSSAFYGAEQSMFFLLRHMDRGVFEPVVVLPGGKGALVDKLDGLGLKKIVLEAPTSWIRPAAPLEAAAGLVSELKLVGPLVNLIRDESIDIVYTNTMTRISGAIAARLAGKPHVWHIREVLKDHPLRSPFSIDATFGIVECLSDRLITNSKSVAAQFPSAPEGKVSVVYNAVDTGAFVSAKPAGKLRNELGIGQDCPLVGIIGTIHRHKNHEDLLNAFAHLKKDESKAKLLIIGQPDREYKPVLLELIERHSLGDSVKFVDFRNDMPEVFSELDIIVVASLGEPFGRTTIEAMAAGKPVVATNTGASPEIVVDGVTGLLVPVRAPDRMAEAIMRILGDPALAERMGAAGRERVLNVFTKENYISGIESVFREVHGRYEKEAPRPSTHEKLLYDVSSIIGPDELYGIFMQISKLAKMERELAEKDRLLAEKDRQIQALLDSWSWKVTGPLRRVFESARKP
ncbi:MAG: glycosyltransferase family 4 protein [Thermodesulfobacteriota bacterium]|nr:MAG: glycosyltransferase family 4 protein [Thermodesulfobacteriota bacterium]